MPKFDLLQPYDALKKRLLRYKSLAVAFSGGVDSTLLLAAARQVLPGRLLAVTAASPIVPAKEIRAAQTLAASIGVEHVIFESREMGSAKFLANPPNRCYVCKTLLFKEIFSIAADAGINTVAHGANSDDDSDYRPGMAAARAMGVVAPLADAGLGKREIRNLSREFNLDTWNKPAMACLASRIPYGTPITNRALAMVESAEAALAARGFAVCRVRHHGDTARIEVAAEDIIKFLDGSMRTDISNELKSIGFDYVCLDLDGYMQGSLNRGIRNE